MTTHADVAKWMNDNLRSSKCLYQDMAAMDIISIFGDEFTYMNENGNIAINKKVLYLFKKLTGDSVVWERGQRMWRHRENHDEPGRLQDY